MTPYKSLPSQRPSSPSAKPWCDFLRTGAHMLRGQGSPGVPPELPCDGVKQTLSPCPPPATTLPEPWVQRVAAVCQPQLPRLPEVVKDSQFSALRVTLRLGKRPPCVAGHPTARRSSLPGWMLNNRRPRYVIVNPQDRAIYNNKSSAVGMVSVTISALQNLKPAWPFSLL